MDSLQDFLTLIATIVEYFFFAYLAVAFMIYSLKRPNTVPQPRTATVAQPTWARSADPDTSSLAVMAG